MMKKSTVLLFSVLLVISMTTWAGGQKEKAGTAADASTVVIRVKNFGSDKDAEAFHAAYERFKGTHPNVQVVDTFVPIGTWREYTAKTLAEAAAGQAPDILALTSESIRQIHSVDLLESLNDLISGDEEARAILNDISPTLRKDFELEGRTWAIPTNFNGIYAYYNKDLFEKAGLSAPTKDGFTWEALRTAAMKLTQRDAGGNTTVWGFAPDTWLNGLSAWVYSNGSEMLSDNNTRSNLKDPAVAEAFQFLADMILVDKTVPRPSADANANGQSYTNLFANGKLGIIYGGHQYTQVFMENNFTNYDVARIAWNKSHTSSFGCAAFTLTKASRNKDIAWEVLKEMVSVQTQTQQAQQGTSIPSRRSVAMGPDFLKWPQNASLFYGLLDEPEGFLGVSAPGGFLGVSAPVNYTEFESIMFRYVNQIFSGSMTAAQAMEQADAEVQKALERTQN